MMTINTHYYFDIKIKNKFEAEFNQFLKGLYDIIDERVISNKPFLETTNKYLSDVLFGNVRSSIMNYLGRWNEFYKDSGEVTYDFSATQVDSKYYITLDDNELDSIIYSVFIVPLILMGYHQHDKDVVTRDYGNYIIEQRELDKIKKETPGPINPKDAAAALLEEYKNAVPWGKAIITQQDIANALNISRSTFQSRCTSHGFRWVKKRRAFIDLEGKNL